MYHLNNWITYNNNSIKINNYNMNLNICSTFEDTLISQAKLIYDSFKNIKIFVSGGIDSQTVAYAFKKANLPVEYYFLKINYKTNYNKAEYFFATEFCKKYEISLNILNFEYTHDDILEMILETNFYDNETGVGVLFQNDMMNKFLNQNDGIIVTGYGIFLFKREHNICKGLIPSLYSGHAYGCDIKRSISFFYYSPLIFKHYEYLHKNDKTLQYPKKFQPKNLVFNQLGFFLRPKLKGCEHLDFQDSYSELTIINYGQDGNNKFKRNSQEILFDELFINKKNKIKLLKNKKENTLYTTLYEFETDVCRYD